MIGPREILVGPLVDLGFVDDGRVKVRRRAFGEFFPGVDTPHRSWWSWVTYGVDRVSGATRWVVFGDGLEAALLARQAADLVARSGWDPLLYSVGYHAFGG